MPGGFPANLTAEPGLVAGGLNVRNIVEEVEEDGSDEVPVFGATGEECAEPEVVAASIVDVEGCEVAGTGGSNIKTEAEILDFGFWILDWGRGTVMSDA